MGFKRDLLTLAVDAGVGTHNVNIFTSTKSSPPLLASGEASMSIIETGGIKPLRTNTTRVAGGTVQKVTLPAYEQPSAAIIIRGTQAGPASAMARAAYNAWAGFRNGFINSGWYREINVESEPIDNGIADRGEIRYTFSVTAIKRPS